MGWVDRLLGRRGTEAASLYAAAVARAREPHWYVDGAVPDTVDGRFDMIAAVLSMLLLRLEREPGRDAARLAVHATEQFVDDMDSQLRQIGIGDITVGKHIGRMMAALGGRMGAYRDALAAGTGLDDALVRNLYRGVAPPPAALAHVAAALVAFRAALDGVPVARLAEGEIS